MSNLTMLNQTDLDPEERVYMYSFIIIISALITLTILGNGLVCLTVMKSHELQLSVANYFVFSQAIADIMVATLAMPSWIFVATFPQLSQDQLRNATILTKFIDVLCCSASIANVSLISLDRYWAVNRPLRYYEIVTPHRAKVGIAFVWLFAVMIALLGLGTTTNNETYIQTYLLLISLSCFLIPLLIIIVAYCHIYKAAIKQIRKLNYQYVHQNGLDSDSNSVNSKRRSREVRRIKFFKELRITKAIAVVVGLFVVCWGPFFAVHLIETFFPSTHIPSAVLYVVVFLPYVFCCVNPWFYAGLNREFRMETKQLLKKILYKMKCRDVPDKSLNWASASKGDSSNSSRKATFGALDMSFQDKNMTEHSKLNSNSAQQLEQSLSSA